MPTPFSESLEGAPSWAVQENLLAHSYIRDGVLDFGGLGTAEIVGAYQNSNGTVQFELSISGQVDPLTNHMLIRNGDTVLPPIGGQGWRRFPAPVWLMLAHRDTVIEIYK